MFILRAFQIADGCVAADIFSSLERGLFDGPDFIAGVSGIQIIHHIFQNNQHLIVLVNRIHTVIEGDKPAAQGGEHNVRVFARLNVIPPQPGEILTRHQIDLSGGSIRNQAVEARSVECRAGNAVITVCVIQIPALLPHIAAEHLALR